MYIDKENAQQVAAYLDKRDRILASYATRDQVTTARARARAELNGAISVLRYLGVRVADCFDAQGSRVGFRVEGYLAED